jgi:hypothetical protein
LSRSAASKKRSPSKKKNNKGFPNLAGISTKDVKDYFCRHFLGVVKVNSVPPAMAALRIISHKRDVETRAVQIQARIKVTGADLPPGIKAQINVTRAELLSSGVPCVSMGFRCFSQSLKINKSKIKRYSPGELAIHTFSKLKTKTSSGMKQMTVLPQERANRLQWQLSRPKKEGEMILAWFGPIVEDAVAKLTLNKRRGTLLIWYNPQSRRFDAKGLYLYRRIGIKENLEWRWL